MPLRQKEGKSYLDKFKNIFSKNDMINVINANDFLSRFIFENHGVEIGYGEERNSKLKEILSKFYT